MIIVAAERIKELREQYHMTQSALAVRLSITRSSVNAWEMGISLPSTGKLIELSGLFHVSCGYLLGLEPVEQLNLSCFSNQEKELLLGMVQYFNANRVAEESEDPSAQ